TCSISSLKLTAPALDLDAKDLADHATKQPLETRVLERRQRANSLFLVGLEEGAGPILDTQLAEHRSEGACTRRRRGCVLPRRHHARGARGPDLVASQREEQRWRTEARPAHRAVGEVFEVIANLIRDPQRLAVVAQDLLRLCRRARKRGPNAQRHLEGGRRLPVKDVQNLIGGWGGGPVYPCKPPPLPDAEPPMSGGGNPHELGADTGATAAIGQQSVPLA